MALPSFSRAIAAAILVAASAPALSSTATAQSAALVTGEIADGEAWATAEVTEATRKDGILTITVRFKAGSDVRNNNTLWFYRTQKEGYAGIYLVAGKKKYFA